MPTPDPVPLLPSFPNARNSIFAAWNICIHTHTQTQTQTQTYHHQVPYLARFFSATKNSESKLLVMGRVILTIEKKKKEEAVYIVSG